MRDPARRLRQFTLLAVRSNDLHGAGACGEVCPRRLTLGADGDRGRVGLLETGLNGGVDLIGREGESLVARVGPAACRCSRIWKRQHVYIAHSAISKMAKSIVLNAKMRRPGVAGAAETIWGDRAGLFLFSFWPLRPA